jgi:hypothetical protein
MKKAARESWLGVTPSIYEAQSAASLVASGSPDNTQYSVAFFNTTFINNRMSKKEIFPNRWLSKDTTSVHTHG